MATLTQIRDAIKAKLEAIPGIGVVHKYERLATRVADLKALYVTGGQLRGWHIRRTATNEVSPTLGSYVIDHRWQIRGFMAIDDSAESEIAFDNLIEAIRDAFRADETLGGLIKGTQVPPPTIGVQLIEHGPVMFADVLCHGARLNLATRHFRVGV
ncbi:hypothetical protein [Dongia deserti]|uniref:hypothetical protein n=1 Tax=Dongia deserti TaxID=2268030 RepID=UPI000E651937|nr:hypothetical protein [Dongia deserti]